MTFMTDYDRETLGFSRKEQDQFNAFQDIATLCRELNELKKNPELWLKDLIKTAEELIQRFGKYRIHPSASRKYYDNRELFLIPNKDKFDMITGDVFWGQQDSGKPNKKIKTFNTLSDFFNEAYFPD